MSTVVQAFDVEDLHGDNDGKLLELVRGQPVEKDMASLAIWVVTQVTFLLKLALHRGEKGTVYAELPVACFPWLPNHARRPDVVYFSEAKLPDPTIDLAAITAVPDLCIEVLSKNDNALEVEAKIAEYLKAGVPLIWIIDPYERTVRVIHASRKSEYLAIDDTINAAPFLPAFSARVADFFPPGPAAARELP